MSIILLPSTVMTELRAQACHEFELSDLLVGFGGNEVSLG
jgi:hypothetical protein